jgi:hypothetical protein
MSVMVCMRVFLIFGLVRLTYFRCLDVWYGWFGSFDVQEMFGVVRMMNIPDVWFGSFVVHQMFAMFRIMGIPDVLFGK